MHTRSSQNKITGKFTVTVWDWNGVECFKGEFNNMHEADRAGEREERAMTLRMSNPLPELTAEELAMTDDELMAALKDF